MTQGFADFLEERLDYKLNVFHHKDKNYSQLCFRGKELIKLIFSSFYKDCSIYLDRKKEIVDKLFASETLSNKYRTKAEFEQLIKICKTNVEIGKHLNLNARTVGHWRKKFSI